MGAKEINSTGRFLLALFFFTLHGKAQTSFFILITVIKNASCIAFLIYRYAITQGSNTPHVDILQSCLGLSL